MPKNEKKNMDINLRYALTGAGIGLYFAIFSRPTGAPDFLIAIILAVIAALFTVLVQSWKKHRPFIEILRDFFSMLLLYSAFMVAMQLRHLANNIGGQLVVGVVTVIIGIITGLFFAARAKAAGQS
jgi:hypothetical protein